MNYSSALTIFFLVFGSCLVGASYFLISHNYFVLWHGLLTFGLNLGSLGVSVAIYKLILLWKADYPEADEQSHQAHLLHSISYDKFESNFHRAAMLNHFAFSSTGAVLSIVGIFFALRFGVL